jgi:aldehyde dehydrogenase (NAD+)
MQKEWSHFIGGAFVDTVAKLDEFDPRTEAVSFRIGAGDAATVATAVADAQGALMAWRALKPLARGRILVALAGAIRANAGRLSEIERAETGKPLAVSLAEVEVTAQYFEFYGGIAPLVQGETIPLGPDYLSYSIREPFGVVAIILPWNSPLTQAARGIAPALAAGNTVVAKPSEYTSVGLLALAAMASEAGLPAGVLNVVTGTGEAVGAPLVSHPDIRKVAFTGSLRAGQAIGHIAADRIIPLTLELGGKSPNIVFADADLEKAAAGAIAGFTLNSGQVCVAGSRLLVQALVYDTLLEKLESRLSAVRLETGEGTGLGPIITRAQYNRVRSMLRDAYDDGARPLTAAPALPQTGWYVAPTILVDVTPQMTISREEVFGPVMTVMRFDKEAEAIAMANDTNYGLVAGLWTGNLDRAHRVAAQLDAGQVFVNEFPSGSVETPFGGFKQSGYGREKGIEALHHYTQSKTVIVRIAGGDR